MAIDIPSLAKLSRPRLHGALPRSRLFDLFHELEEIPLNRVAGPAPSAKSTLVASYLEANDISMLWYQVDETDHDPASFFFYMGMLAKQIGSANAKPLPYLKPEYLPDFSGF